MIYTELGKSGTRISSIGVGTWQFGTKLWGWGKGYGRGDAIEAVRRSIELGVNLIDTAEIYGNGTSEEIVGDAIKDMRDEVVIATKVWGTNLTYRRVLRACERSLRRLKTDVIDLYQIHWPNPFIPMRETMRAMERLVKEGKVRHIGVSNFPLRMMVRAQEALSREEIVSNQVKYNLIERGPEKDLIPYAKRERITIISYSPLAQGMLTGKYNPNNRPKDLVRRVNVLFDKGNLRRLEPLMNVLARVAESKGVSVVNLALCWLIRSPEIVAIPGVKNARQAEENARSAEVVLTEAELEEIERAYRSVKIDKFVSFLRIPLNLMGI
ncbi:MAG: aldo/keto reductase [Aigarchaeota archaeon]|nr:aldo/keto reductase [Aigarchaeota archaeon]MDW8092540.1 aldo/keto reductase [Nitrososphaerota archaeon]